MISSSLEEVKAMLKAMLERNKKAAEMSKYEVAGSSGVDVMVAGVQIDGHIDICTHHPNSRQTVNCAPDEWTVVL